MALRAAWKAGRFSAERFQAVVRLKLGAGASAAMICEGPASQVRVALPTEKRNRSKYRGSCGARGNSLSPTASVCESGRQACTLFYGVALAGTRRTSLAAVERTETDGVRLRSLGGSLRINQRRPRRASMSIVAGAHWFAVCRHHCNGVWGQRLPECAVAGTRDEALAGSN